MNCGSSSSEPVWFQYRKPTGVFSAIPSGMKFLVEEEIPRRPEFGQITITNKMKRVLFLQQSWFSGKWDHSKMSFLQISILQKLNGTESQRTPDQVSCDRAIRSSGFFGVRSVGPVGDFLNSIHPGDSRRRNECPLKINVLESMHFLLH